MKHADYVSRRRCGIRKLASHIVRETGCGSVSAESGEEALGMYEREKPDLLILDVMMPGLNGFEVTSLLRGREALTPILLLTAKGDIVDKSKGLKAGADE